jgi:hypothetical protein
VYPCGVPAFDGATLKHGQQLIAAALNRHLSLVRGVSEVPRPCTRRVYAARLSNVRNGRTVRGEAVFSRLLEKDYNFTIIDGGHSLLEWAELLREACVFMGPHGGALSHLFLLPRRDGNGDPPLVVELVTHDKYSVYWALAAGLGQRMAWLPIAPFIEGERNMAEISQLLMRVL